MQEGRHQDSKGRTTLRHAHHCQGPYELDLQALVSSYHVSTDSQAHKFFRGCVTPQQISNITLEIDDDVMNLDGYEELPKEVQEKVARTFKQGHVDDEDWNGVRDSFHFVFVSESLSEIVLGFCLLFYCSLTNIFIGCRNESSRHERLQGQDSKKED
jgi:hypothetical protein